MISRWFQLGLIWHAIFKFDGEVTQGARPVWDGERPLAADVFQAQVEEFIERVDGRKAHAFPSTRGNGVGQSGQ